MKTKAKKTEECATLFEIEVPKETVEKALEEVYGEIVKIADIPGFRTGKAPRDLVKKHYTGSAREEALKRLIPDAYRSALKEHKVNPISLPQISDVAFEEGKALFFKARVETRPEFKIKDYKGIKVEKKKAVVTDEEVAKMLENLREMHAKYIGIEDRSLQLDDYAVSDLECFVENKPIHKKRENLWLHVSRESFIPGLAEKLAGMKKGEEKDIEVTLPEKYPDKKVAGKPATYHIKVKEIKSRILPALDDEFAKDLSKGDLNELKKGIAEELEKRAEMNSEIGAENRLLEKLMDDNVFKVPQGLVRQQLDLMVADAKARLVEKGFKKEDLDKKDEDFKGKFKEEAVRRVRLMFILDSIADENGIEVSDKDMEEAYKAIALQTGNALEKVKGYYKDEELEGNLTSKIREEKTIKFLLDNAEIVTKEN